MREPRQKNNLQSKKEQEFLKMSQIFWQKKLNDGPFNYYRDLFLYAKTVLNYM